MTTIASIIRSRLDHLPSFCCSLCFVAASMLASAADQGADDGAINVFGHAIESHDYRDLIAAVDTFEREKVQHAPNASFRFRLIALKEGASLDGAKLTVIGDEKGVDIPIATDGSFSIPRDQTLYDERASVQLNRVPGTFGWSPVVESANIPADARRLGDLRVQCAAAEAAGLKPTGISIGSVLRMLDWPRGYCQVNQPHFPAPPGYDGANLIDGAHQKALPRRIPRYGVGKYGEMGTDMRGPGQYETGHITLSIAGDRHDYLVNGLYVVPLTDREWSDDALLVFSQHSGQAMSAESGNPAEQEGN